MLYALEERKVYKKSIIDDELKSANMAIAKTAFAFVKGAVSYLYHSLLSSYHYHRHHRHHHLLALVDVGV